MLHDKGVQDLLVLVEVLLEMLVEVGEVQTAPVIALEQLLQLDYLLILDAPEYGPAVRVAGCHGIDRHPGPVGHLAQRYEAEGLALEEVPERMLYGMRGPVIISVHLPLPPSSNSKTSERQVFNGSGCRQATGCTITRVNTVSFYYRNPVPPAWTSHRSNF